LLAAQNMAASMTCETRHHDDFGEKIQSRFDGKIQNVTATLLKYQRI